eukprot:1840308-Rhodomonas_salina.3
MKGDGGVWGLDGVCVKSMSTIYGVRDYRNSKSAKSCLFTSRKGKFLVRSYQMSRALKLADRDSIF